MDEEFEQKQKEQEVWEKKLQEQELKAKQEIEQQQNQLSLVKDTKNALAEKYGGQTKLQQIEATISQLEKKVGEEDGNSLLHVAVESQDELVVQYLLEERGLSPDLLNSNGETPLHIACINSNQKIVDLLIKVFIFNLTPSF